MYKFYEDPGHGWLAVKRVELVALDIADKITPYSYQRGATVYLEEDCDADIFIKAKGGHVEYETIYHDRTPIRSYAPYQTGG